MKLLSLLASLLCLSLPAVYAQQHAGAEAVNAFALDFCRKVTGEDRNVLVSPWSVASTFTMAFEGAAGKTRDEMAAVLHLGSEPQATADKIVALRRDLAETVEKNARDEVPLTFRTASRLYGQRGFPLRQDFLQRMKDVWQAPLEELDFFASPSDACRHINDWVRAQTADKIPVLLPPGSLEKDTRLVLVNALYFKSIWMSTFSPGETRWDSFYNHGTTPARVAMMHQKEFLHYHRAKEAHVIGLSYRHWGFRFLILLPHQRDGLNAVEKSLTAARLTEWTRLLKRTSVSLSLPKFRIAHPSMDLTQALQSLGMNTALDVPRGSADFSGIAPSLGPDNLNLDAVFHQTLIEVDEQGTVAAAATGGGFGPGGGSPAKPVFVRVDHPFLFAIQHQKSGLC